VLDWKHAPTAVATTLVTASTKRLFESPFLSLPPFRGDPKGTSAGVAPVVSGFTRDPMRKRSKDQEEGNHPQKQELDPSFEAICGLNTWVPPGLHAMEPGPEGLRGWMNRPFNHPVEGKGKHLRWTYLQTRDSILHDPLIQSYQPLADTRCFGKFAFVMREDKRTANSMQPSVRKI